MINYNYNNIEKEKINSNKIHQNEITSLNTGKISKNLLISTSSDNSSKLIDLNNNKLLINIQNFSKKGFTSSSIDYKTSNIISLSTNDGTVLFFDIRDYNKPIKCLTFNNSILTIDFNHYNSLFSVGESNGIIDIYDLRNDKNIIQKSGEHSFLSKKAQNQDKDTYNPSSETLLCWRLRKPLPGLINHTSSKYDLFNRDMKNISKTKETIVEEVKKLSESFNPSHRQKGLTEYIHLSRVAAPNVNQDYLNAFEKNPNVFRRRNDFSSEFYDIYNQYSSLCDKPFAKFNILKAG